MSAASAHPRRRAARSPSPNSLIDSFQNMSINKGSTFHVPNITETDLWDPLAKSASPSMPFRSTTCPKALEELLIGAGERRTADLIARVDKAIATQSKLALGMVLSEPEVLPVPTFMLNQVTLDDEAVLSKPGPRQHRNSHSSDSGIGSSVADSADSIVDEIVETDTAPASNITRPFDDISSATEERGLSKYAKEQIHKHIIKPILREQSLKEFHPLISGVPERIGNKEIKNLRDLEKTLIFLAPDYSRSPSKYLQFCERTIRVLHTTVTTLHESDQRAPDDRSYTQGYFFDLIEQIRRYATILAATREKQAKGEKLDEMDYSPGESVSIQGGVSHNGKPAQLVRQTKDGKYISLETGEILSAEDVASASMKRPMSDVDADADEALRSMARRKKNAPIESHSCHICDKTYTRPCDLTKHIKTHERPWKCSEPKCKYHEHGWPTEKERDRHVNDKHSTAPSLYHCLYKPCPYTSKRESNCKQHMEKAHGWNYVRSKNNGKGRATDVARLPRGSVPPSPSSSVITTYTPIAPSPSVPSLSDDSRRSSMAPPPSVGPSNFGTPAFTHPSPDFAGHFNMNFDFNSMASSYYPITPAMSDNHTTASSNSALMLDGNGFENGYSPEGLDFDPNFDFNNFSMTQQQPTPGSNAGPNCEGFASSSAAAYTSPGAQPDVTFTAAHDKMVVDEGFAGDFGNPGEDFTLFNPAPVQPTSTGGDMFPALQYGSWGDFGGQFDFAANPTGRLQTENSALRDLFPELN